MSVAGFSSFSSNWNNSVALAVDAAHLCVCEQVVCVCVYEFRYQCICNPEVCQKCRKETELPSVSPLPTSSAVLTVFLMHNYPHTYSKRLILLHKIASIVASAHS